MFRPVKTKKVYEEIIGQIKKLIIDGELQPGDKLLSERELSERLSVSRASVREAFSALEMMGVITIKPGEGSFVRQVSFQGMLEPLSFILQTEPTDIIQLLEVRKILESEAAAMAAKRATPQDREAIFKAMNSMVQEIESGGLGDIGDTAFHFTVVKAANNPILTLLMKTIADLMTDTFRATRKKLFIIENLTNAVQLEHFEIYDAIINKRPHIARKKMREHLATIEESTLNIQQGNIQFHVINESEKTKG